MQHLLDEIAKEIERCPVCPINKYGKPVVGEGSADADVVFVGEAPGKKEAETGKPFVGRSGQLLRKLIQEIGLQEDEVYITSPVKYLPNGPDGTPGGTPKPADIAHGRIHLMKQLKVIKPKIVVLLGRVAAEGVLQKKVVVALDHGAVIEENNNIKYFLTIHPAAVLRFPRKYKSTLEGDFQRLKSLVQRI